MLLQRPEDHLEVWVGKGRGKLLGYEDDDVL